MAKSFKVITDLRGGRNGADPPLSLPENQCTEALNVDWYDGMIARKRPGCAIATLSGGTAFSGSIRTLKRHIPAGDETLAQLWGIDGAATPLMKRLYDPGTGVTWENVTLDDAIAAARPQDAVGVSFNGKLFWFYDSAKDRSHVYDPAVNAVRPVGLAASAAPTVANTGAGAYAAVLRYYKQDTIQLNGSVIVRQSELSPSVSFTPSGAGTAARVTRGTFPNERETHWRVWGSTDGITYYNISGNIVVGTTTYDDSAATTTYSSNTVALAVGTYTTLTSGKYGMTDGNRLLFAGAWETGGKNSRVWFTPVLGSLDQGDDERILNTATIKNYVDLNENDGGAITGMGGPLGGSIFVFKYRRVYKLVPTGDVTTPYLTRQIRSDIGCISHKSICVGEDEGGQAALYWMSHKGPYRLGASGIQYLGRDCEDIWQQMILTTNVAAHTVYHSAIHQVWFHSQTDVNQFGPNLRMVFDVLLGRPDEHGRIRGGWAKHTSDTSGPCFAYCSELFSHSIGSSMSSDLRPYVGGKSGGSPILLECDQQFTNDNGVNFQGYVISRPLLTGVPLGVNIGVGEPSIVARLIANIPTGTISLSGKSVSVTLVRDFGMESKATTETPTQLGSETFAMRKYEGGAFSGLGVVQVQVGDTAASASSWVVDAVVLPITPQEQR